MRKRLVLIGLAALLATVSAAAKPPDNKGRPTSEHSSPTGGEVSDADVDRAGGLARITVDIGTARRLAADYRLSGQQALPPGIRKNLARGKPLPPGIAKRSLPTPYLRQLPVYPGYEWQMAGSDLVLLEAASGVIADVLIDVFN